MLKHIGLALAAFAVVGGGLWTGAFGVVTAIRSPRAPTATNSPRPWVNPARPTSLPANRRPTRGSLPLIG